MDDKLILPIHFADGSSKSIAVPHSSTVKNVIDIVLAKSPAALLPSGSNKQFSSVDLHHQQQNQGKDGHMKPIKLESSEWRLMVVRKFRREGQVFTVGELNDPSTVRVMGPQEHVSNELGKWLGGGSGGEGGSGSPVKGGRLRRKSNTTDSREAPRFKLVHPEFVVKVQFRSVTELPGDYVTSIYVTPTMTADTFVELLINEFTLRPGFLATPEESPQQAKRLGSRYALLEVREMINGTFDNHRINEKDCIWHLWTESQKMMGSKALRNAYFCLKPDEMSWLKKMNTQAKKMMSGTSSTYSMQSTNIPVSHSSSASQLSELVRVDITEKREQVRQMLQQPNGMEKATVELESCPDAEFDALFDRFLDDINIRNAESRRDMNSYDRKKKSLLLIQQLKNQKDTTSEDTREMLNAVADMTSPTSASATGQSFFNFLKKESAQVEKTAQYYIEKLSTRQMPAKTLLKVLVSLRVTLSTAKMAWIREFVDNGAGISALGGVLDRVLVAHKSSSTSSGQTAAGQQGKFLDAEEDIKAECVKCLRVLLNTEPGYYNVLQSQLIVTKLTLCLHTANDRVRMTVAEVLAALCVLSHEGHRMVLNAFVDFRGFYSEPKKFNYLVDSVISQSSIGSSSSATTFSDSNHPLLAYDYKTTAMSLINVLVNTPDEVSERQTIRKDIIGCGFEEYIRSGLRSTAPSALAKQIDVFEEELREDVNELKIQEVVSQSKMMLPVAPSGEDQSSAAAAASEMLMRQYEKVLRENAHLNNELSDQKRHLEQLQEDLLQMKQQQNNVAEPKAVDVSGVNEEQMQRLQNDLRQRTDEVDDLKAAVDSKADEVKSIGQLMESALKQLEQSESEWKAQRSQLESEIQVLKQSSGAQALPQTESPDWQKEKAQLEAQIESLVNQLQQQQVSQGGSAAIVTIPSDDQVESIRKAKQLEEELQKVREKLSNAESQLKKADAQAQTLTAENQELKLVAAEAEQSARMAEDLAEAKGQLTELQIEVQERDAKILQLRKEIEAKSLQIKVDEEKLLQKDHEIKSQQELTKHVSGRDSSGSIALSQGSVSLVRDRAGSVTSTNSPAPVHAASGRAADLMSKLAVKEKECEKLQAEIDRFHQRQRERSEMVQMMVKNFEMQMQQIAKGESTGQPMFDSRMGAIMEELVKFKQQAADLTLQLETIKALFPDGVDSYKRRLEEQSAEFASKEKALQQAAEQKEKIALDEIVSLKQKLEDGEVKFQKDLEEQKQKMEKSLAEQKEQLEKELSQRPPAGSTSPSALSGLPAPPAPECPPALTGMAGPPPPPPPQPEVSDSGMAVAPPGPPPPPAPPGAPGAPPPPPGMGGFAPVGPIIPAGFKAKPKVKPAKPMKNLYWTKLPVNSVGDTVWKELQDEQEITKSMNIDEVTMLFGKSAAGEKPAAGADDGATASNSRKSAGTSQAVTILDTNRAQQVSIVLARIKMSYPEVCKAFLSLNDELLAVDQLKSLQQFTPTDEEIESISEFVNTKSQELKCSPQEASEGLGNAEKYFYAVMKIPRLQQRLNCWLFRRRFDSDMRDCRLDLEMVLSAIDEVRKSQKMKKLLKTVLAFGNYLNGGTNRGEAFGVQLDALVKTKDLKVNPVKFPISDAGEGGDAEEAKAKALKFAGVNSLLHYLVKLSSDFGGFDYLEEMPHLESACRVSTQALRAQVKAIKTGFDQINAEIKALKDSPIPDDKFVTKMEAFVSESDQFVGDLQKLIADLDNESKSLLVYYGSDPAQSSLEEFFNTFLSFNTTINQCKKDIDDATKKLLKPQNSPPFRKKIGGVAMGVTMEKGDLENAIKTLKVGSSRKSRFISSNTEQSQRLDEAIIPPKPQLSAIPPKPVAAEESEVLKRIRKQRENLEKSM